MHGNPGFAPWTGRRQRVRAVDLPADGTVHVVVPEQTAAHDGPAGFVRRSADEGVHQIEMQRRTTE
jgi:hypothetical protein